MFGLTKHDRRRGKHNQSDPVQSLWLRISHLGFLWFLNKGNQHESLTDLGALKPVGLIHLSFVLVYCLGFATLHPSCRGPEPVLNMRLASDKGTERGLACHKQGRFGLQEVQHGN